MKKTFLISRKWRFIGFSCIALILILSTLLLQNPEIKERASIFYILELFLILGIMLTIWGKFKIEDEFTSHLRFSSSLQAIVASAGYFLITYSSIYGLEYWFLSLFNPLVPFVLYFLLFWGKVLFLQWKNNQN